MGDGRRIYRIRVSDWSFDDILVNIYDKGSRDHKERVREQQEVNIDYRVAGGHIYTLLTLKNGVINWNKEILEFDASFPAGPIFKGTNINPINLIKKIKFSSEDSELIRKLLGSILN